MRTEDSKTTKTKGTFALKCADYFFSVYEEKRLPEGGMGVGIVSSWTFSPCFLLLVFAFMLLYSLKLREAD